MIGKTVVKQIIGIEQNISKMPLRIILKQPSVKIMIVLYFAIIIQASLSKHLPVSG